MAALIEAAQEPNYPAEIVIVVSNRPDAAGLDPEEALAELTRDEDEDEDEGADPP